MFGISAGSLMLAREWVRFPDDDETYHLPAAAGPGGR